MEIILDSAEGNSIKFYQPGSVRIGSQTYIDNILLTPHSIITAKLPESVQSLTSNNLQPILQFKPDICIFGTGLTHQQLPMECMLELAKNKIGFEVMNNYAACRTYNVLMSENRNVLLALIPIQITE